MAELGQIGEVGRSGQWEIRTGKEEYSTQGREKPRGEVEEGGLWLPAAAVPWFRQEDEKVKEKQVIRTGRVMPAGHYALSTAMNPRQVAG